MRAGSTRGLLPRLRAYRQHNCDYVAYVPGVVVEVDPVKTPYNLSLHDLNGGEFLAATIFALQQHAGRMREIAGLLDQCAATLRLAIALQGKHEIPARLEELERQLTSYVRELEVLLPVVSRLKERTRPVSPAAEEQH